MSRVSEETIAPRIHIGLCGDESARCSASNRFDLPNRFLSVHAVVHNTFNGTVNLVGLAALASRHGGE
jgi:hypothetical protein